MTEKKTKKIPVIKVILLGLILYVAVRYVIGDGRAYDYVEDTAIYGTQEANPIYGQNVLKGDDDSLYIVYNSDRHVETYKGNFESKEYMKQNHLNMYDMNVIGNTVYALEGAEQFVKDDDIFISFNLTTGEEKNY